MKKLVALASSLFLSCAVFVSPLAAAHATMKSSVPAANATVDVAPKEISLTFNEKIEETFSAVTVKDASGKTVSTAKAHVDAATPDTLHLDLQALPSGTYTVQYVAVGHDGHRRNGDFKFTVK